VKNKKFVEDDEDGWSRVNFGWPWVSGSVENL
jgi:hypothetical protein